MCSIYGILRTRGISKQTRALALEQSKLLRHRGPDWSGVYQSDHGILVHERLAIVDVESGAQPLIDKEHRRALAVNGEIYNHRSLRSLNASYLYQTESDCEVILALFEIHGLDLLQKLEGMYAFILFDELKNDFLIARDPLGIIPLYYAEDTKGRLHVASELKALEGICPEPKVFPPGHYLTADMQVPKPFFEPAWKDYRKRTKVSSETLHEALSESVKSHLMTDVPYGVLLSGGLDSSLIAALAKRYADKRIESDSKDDAWWPTLHSFSIGLEGAPDLLAAEKVAEHIGSVHHGFAYSIQEGIDALSDVIYHIESYDVTTIRASVPMYLLARKIRSMGIKMVLSGEGSDELFGGYLYFHKAPSAEEFHDETVRKLAHLHQYDCLRANKAMAAWGVEARVPFLDKRFTELAMSIDADDKMITGERIEKHILRQAFEGLLPDDILWRQKEQFSDGVGYGWIDSLRQLAELHVSDKQLADAKDRFPINTPLTKEAYHYRIMFEKHFPSDAAARTVPQMKSVACSTEAALRWDKAFMEAQDPSGRAVSQVHQQAY